MNSCEKIGASFRDPSGFVFKREGVLFRQVNFSYKEDYGLLMGSGLYRELTDTGLLIPHKEREGGLAYSQDACKILEPEPVEFISYPYEWCFSQIRDAALALLKIQAIALNYGMSLKDFSLYNIQFKKCKPVLIDTLSFERYKEGTPWVAYRQFCQHFLATLGLMSYSDSRLNQLLRVYMDGIPLDLAVSLLPFRSRLNPGLFIHLHLHSAAMSGGCVKDGKKDERQGRFFSKFKFSALINSLESAIRGLRPCDKKTQWSAYYEGDNHSQAYFQHKSEAVESYLDKLHPVSTCWDLGANNGRFSRICAKKGISTVSFDNDLAAVEKNYCECAETSGNILPLYMDLTNPSGSIGWNNAERLSLAERGPAGLVLALAFIHHLAISNNLPFEDIAHFFSKICKFLIIEFVSKEDIKAKEMLKFREDIFNNYNQEHFEGIFGKYFAIEERILLEDSVRTLYLMQKK